MAQAREEWYLSADGEAYGPTCYGSRNAAVDDALAMWKAVRDGHERATDLFDADDAKRGDSVFYVGRRMEWHHEVDEDPVIYEALTDAYDYAGELAFGWLEDVTGEEREALRSALQGAFDGWLAETGREPTFFMVETSEEIDAECCDPEAASGR